MMGSGSFSGVCLEGNEFREGERAGVSKTINKGEKSGMTKEEFQKHAMALYEFCAF